MPYICEKCGFSCDSQTKLNTHLNKKTPCISDENNKDGIECEFCNNVYSTNSNLKRHYTRCVVRKNPELLLKHIEHQKEIIQQKDQIIEQKDQIIEQLKDTKSTVDIDISSATDNSINKTIKTNVDNSTNITNNITNNITLIEQPFALRFEDMSYLLQYHENNNSEEFWILAENIRKSMKNGNLDGMINSLLTYIHNNKNLKQGQNIRYCPEGEHKDELLIYDYDEKGIGYWRPSDIRPVAFTLSQEFDQIHSRQRIKDSQDNKSEDPNITKKEQRNMEKFEGMSTSLYRDLENQEALLKFIKKFHSSKYVPENLRDDMQNDNIHPKNDEKSPAVIAHKQYIRKNKSCQSKTNKSTKPSKSSKKELEQKERDRLHEESRQKRKAEEAEDERKEEEYKRKCEADGIEYESKATRAYRKQYAEQAKTR